MPLEDSVWSRVPESKSTKSSTSQKKASGLGSSIWAQDAPAKSEPTLKDEKVERHKKASRQDKPKRQDKPIKRDAGNSRRRTSININNSKINPLAARLGMVHIDDTSEESDSEEVSRPSTSDKNMIFDRRPSKGKKMNSTTNHNSKKDHSKASKTDLLKRKIDEQKKIQERNNFKAQQSNLLNDFLKDDTVFDWDDEIK